MDEAAVESRWEELRGLAISPEWFNNLRDFYRDCDARQHAELRRRLGWSIADCQTPVDPFAADFSERVRPHLVDAQSCVRRFAPMIGEGWKIDFRDGLIFMVGLYHACILAGLDPDAVFAGIAAQLPEIRKNINAFAARREWLFPCYEPVRLRNGHVHVRRV